MKKTALLKDTLREIKKTLGRFISIFMIVAIGVAFFAGVRASAPIMKSSADSYFDDYNLMDFKLMSTIGMTQEDADAIAELDGVEGVYASHSMDVLNVRENKQSVYKLMSMPSDTSASNKNYINQLRVIEGRLPETEDEIVLENDNIRNSGYSIGDTITFTSGTDEELSESLARTTFTVVGKVNTPYYLSYEKGSTTIGNGEISNYALILDTNFTSEYYSEIYVTVEGAKELNSYDDAYFDKIDLVESALTALGDERADLRFEEIRQNALDEVEKGRKEYEEQKALFEEQIKEAQNQLDQAHDQILIGQATLNSQQITMELMLESKEAELKESEEMLSTIKTEYDSAVAYLAEMDASLKAQLPDLNQQIEDANAQIAEMDQKIADIDKQLENDALTDIDRALLESEKKGYETTKKITQSGIDLVKQEISRLNNLYESIKNQIDSLGQQLAAAQQQVETGKQQLEDAKVLAQKQMEAAQKELDDGQAQMIAGKLELEKQTKDGEEQLLIAKEKLDRAEEDILAMETPTWYVLNRQMHYSYMDYGSAADRMGAIAKVFPVFFFLVAALVCLTTMTRMVDEQRQEIGTLKALGYSKTDIALKFVLYAAIASIFGGIFGAIVGIIVFPTVIYYAWGIMYNMPGVQLDPQFGIAIMAILLASVITIGAAFAAVYKELMEVPSQLMRPKAPKSGKKILLERIPFLWKRFSFTQKVTARNIFRYKKRFFMTVIGISGCTALLVAGFGIRDSIQDIVTKQFEEIYMFHVSMDYEEDCTLSEREETLASILSEDNVDQAIDMAIYHGLYADSGEDKGVDIYVPMDTKTFTDFFTLRTRGRHETIELSDSGAVITEKLAKDKDLSIGDTFEVDNGDGVKKEIKISGITENYIGHAIYMTPSYYKSVYHETPIETTIFAKLIDQSDDAETQLGNAIMKDDSIASVTFYSGMAATFSDMISSLIIIVIVLVISAGMLAFVVLYNLTNVNISERLREIATIKVLGFYDREVSAYVYRENIVLSLIGACAGLLLGVALHEMIMSLAELDTVMFGRNINKLSFIISLVITMFFAVLVNTVMYGKLKKIPMVESLKSVE